MTATTTVTLVDGVRVVVPDALDLMTSYVLHEQRDWFEDELRFLRRLLQPGQIVIDIGANYGAYTLSLAKAVGPSGSVLAFEPTSDVAQLLSASVAANDFRHVNVQRSAVSAASGTGQLALGQHSELNALVHGTPTQGPVETVPLVTLDDCLREHGWQRVDFVKIDAEGEEHNILRGGERFFSELSPLVQYAVKAGTELHLDLVPEFRARGYDSYRLVPGLDLLVPFDAGSPPDEYLLNLFACKPDQAGRLAAQGRLLSGAEQSEPRPSDWRRAMSSSLPYVVGLNERWERTMATGRNNELGEALALYGISRDASASAADRFAALAASLERLRSLCQREPANLRRASLARVARDYGARALAADALGQLSEALLQGAKVDPGEPFLLPAERFDGIAPGASPANWLLAATLETYEQLSSFSSFFTGAPALPRLQAIRDLGFASDEMQRRLAMLQQRLKP